MRSEHDKARRIAPRVLALAVLCSMAAASAQSLDDLLGSGASKLKRAAEKALRDAATAPPEQESAPQPAVAAEDLPRGWTSRAPHAMEQSFVAPQATTRLASDLRQLKSPGPSGAAWHGNVTSQRIEIDNPYLDPDDPFFSVMQRMACMADGSLAVFSRAKTHPDGYMKGTPYATGIWRVAPDGAITALGGARHTISEGRYPFCGVSPGRSGLNPEEVGPVTVAADGSLTFPYSPLWGFGRHAAVLRLTPDLKLEPVPNDPETCAKEPNETAKKRFLDVSAALRDPQGNTYVFDDGACTLYRVAADGSTSVVLPRERACPAGQPENIFRAEEMAWDAARGELVTSGDLLWLQSPGQDNYSTIWRVSPDGAMRRIFLGRKTTPGTLQQVDGIGGLAVDARGVVTFGAGIAHGHGYRILKLDEAKGRGEVLAGIPSSGDSNHGDGPVRQSQFLRIWGLCYVPDGTLFVHDGTHIVRRITPAGHVTTWAF